MGTGSALGAGRTTALIGIIKEAILRTGCLVEATEGTGTGHMSAEVLAPVTPAGDQLKWAAALPKVALHLMTSGPPDASGFTVLFGDQLCCASGPRSRATSARARMSSFSVSLRHTSAYGSGPMSVTGR
ncbi:hypothetical protein Aros01_04482 [Streptosporangium roseum]